MHISKEDIRRLIGKKLGGWEWSPSAGQPPWLAPDGLTRADSLRDYPSDLNAVQTVIAAIQKNWEPISLEAYRASLSKICGSDAEAIDASARQRCEALFDAFPNVLRHDKSEIVEEWTE